MSFDWKKISFVSALILSMSFSQAFAQSSSSSASSGASKSTTSNTRPEIMRKGSEDMMKNLGLTTEQKQKIDAIMQASKTQADPIMQSIREKKSALMQYLFTSQATKEEALCKAKEITDLKYQLEGIWIDSILKAKCILTTEQQQKFLELHQKRMMQFGKKG